MITQLRKIWKDFWRREDGVATIEFAILFPVMMMVLFAGIEMGMMAFNHSVLEKAVDETVRDIRLNNLEKYNTDEWSHELLKEIVCTRAGFIPDCESNIAIEMIRVDPYVGIDLKKHEIPRCADSNHTALPQHRFHSGQSNDLMILRACVEIDPFFGTSTLTKNTHLKADGQYALAATTVFVHEPL